MTKKEILLKIVFPIIILFATPFAGEIAKWLFEKSEPKNNNPVIININYIQNGNDNKMDFSKIENCIKPSPP